MSARIPCPRIENVRFPALRVAALQGAAALFLLGIVGSGVCLAQGSAPSRKTVAVQVMPAVEQDGELAVQVTKIALDTLENQRNMVTRRYLADKDTRAAEELAKSIVEANRKISTGARSTVFDQGNEEIQGAYLRSKELLGELDAKLVADLYLGLAMAKAVLGEAGLAQEYMAIFRNLLPDRARQSVGYAKLFLDLFDTVEKTRAAGKKRVTVTTEPAGVLVGIDGGTWGKSPLQLDLLPGGHLVQVEEEGYYRAGYIKDPKLDGDKWKITLRPIESRTRFLDTRNRLLSSYFPPPAPPPGKKKTPPPPAPLSADESERLLSALSELLSADCLLFLGVTSEGGGSMRLRGAFVSTFGVFPVDTLVARDLKVIESVRAVVMEASDLERQKTQLAQLAGEKKLSRLSAWADELQGAMASGEGNLMDRARGWKTVGQPQKAELFAATAADVSVLKGRVLTARGRIAAEPDAARDALDLCATEWKVLEPKVRSLLAWDLEGAFRARQAKDIREMYDSARSRLDSVRKMRTELRTSVDKNELKDMDKQLGTVEKSLNDADGLLRKDPLSAEAKRQIYRAVLLETELRRRLEFLLGGR